MFDPDADGNDDQSGNALGGMALPDIDDNGTPDFQ